MPLPQRRSTSYFGWITLAVVAIILYGSFYPFHFEDRSGSPLDALLASSHMRDSRSDILANVLLYIPLGLFALQLFRRRGAANIAVVSLIGMTISVGVELIQFYVPGRQTSFADVCSNSLGTFLGACASSLFGSLLALDYLRPVRKHPSTALILVCWFGYRLFPFVPDIDLHKYWHAVKSLLISPEMPPLNVFRHFVLCLILALLIDELYDGPWKQLLFPLLVGFVFCCRVVIVGLYLSRPEVLGGLLAVICWAAFLSRWKARRPVIFALALILVVLTSLEPFRFETPPRAFTWIPFYGYLHGSEMVNVQSFLEKSFLYGSLIWLALRAGWSWPVATAVCGILVFALRLLDRTFDSKPNPRRAGNPAWLNSPPYGRLCLDW